MSTIALPRHLILFTIIVPLALLMGYLVATPEKLRSLTMVGMLLVALSVPIFVRWHYPLLIFAWNANVIIFFLPGRPALWMLFAGVSLGMTVLTCGLNKKVRFQHVPSVTWPVAFLLLVVLVTVKLTGGIGLQSLGGATYGGKKTVFILASIIGYFALSSVRIPPEKAVKYAGIFFLSGVTGLVSNLIYIGGPAFYFLYLIFPVDNALSQAVEDLSGLVGHAQFSRVSGAVAAGMAGFYFLLLRYGIRGLYERPWRLCTAVALVAFGLLGGFRSVLVICGLVCAAQFYFEGLFRTRIFITAVVSLLLVGAVVTPFAQHLPLSVQRSLSFLPLDVHPEAKLNAQASLEWRLGMWEILVGEIPRHFFLGKGYAIDPTDLYFAEEAQRRGLNKDYEVSLIAGDYHNGPLSVIIPFGIFGVLAFLWFIFASIRALYRNYLYSDDQLRTVNTFLLSYFVGRFVFYMVGFGALNSDLPMFAGIIGLSLAINGGIRSPQRRATSSQPAEANQSVLQAQSA